jgi:hypothetical protein
MSLPIRPGGLPVPYNITCGLNVECSFPATQYEIYVVDFINSFVNNINQTSRFSPPPTNQNILDLKEKLFMWLKDPPPPEEDMGGGGAKKRNKSKRRNQKKSNKKTRHLSMK